jgi:hypothetical protein
MDDHDSDSSFENLYHIPVLDREHHGRDERYGNLGFRVELAEFSSSLTTLTVISKSQAHLPNPSHVEKEDKIIEEDFSVDLVSPPIYDIHPNEEDLLEEVNLFIDTVKFVKIMMFTMNLMKVQRVKYLNGVLRKLIVLIFLGLKIFCQIFLNKILTLVLTC